MKLNKFNKGREINIDFLDRKRRLKDFLFLRGGGKGLIKLFTKFQNAKFKTSGVMSQKPKSQFIN